MTVIINSLRKGRVAVLELLGGAWRQALLRSSSRRAVSALFLGLPSPNRSGLPCLGSSCLATAAAGILGVGVKLSTCLQLLYGVLGACLKRL